MDRKLRIILGGFVSLIIMTAAIFFQQNQNNHNDSFVKEAVNDSALLEETVDASTSESQVQLKDEMSANEETAEVSDKETKEKQLDNVKIKREMKAKSVMEADETELDLSKDRVVLNENSDQEEVFVQEEEEETQPVQESKVEDSTQRSVAKAESTPKLKAELAPKPEPEVPAHSEKPVQSIPEPEVQPEILQTFLADVEQLIFQKVNEERAAVGLSALSYNQTMQRYARIKSADMGDRGYFAHEDLEGDLITTAMKQDGVSYQAWGENIAYISGVSSEALAQQFMTNWMNSDGHRKNILSTNFDSIGVGVYQVGNTVYATQEFMK